MSDTCELICSKLSMMLDMIKLYCLIPVWMTLMLTQGHGVTGKRELARSFCWKIAWSRPKVHDGWLCKGDDCEEVNLLFLLYYHHHRCCCCCHYGCHQYSFRCCCCMRDSSPAGKNGHSQRAYGETVGQISWGMQHRYRYRYRHRYRSIYTCMCVCPSQFNG